MPPEPIGSVRDFGCLAAKTSRMARDRSRPLFSSIPQKVAVGADDVVDLARLAASSTRDVGGLLDVIGEGRADDVLEQAAGATA